jgi:hypothetical protein
MKQDGDDENSSLARKNFLERLGRIVATILNRRTRLYFDLILIALFIGYLAVQEIIKWNTKLLGG